MPFQTATNPKTGEQAVLIDGAWKPFTQSASDKSGAVAYLVDGSWLVDKSRVVPDSEPQPEPKSPPISDRLLGIVETPIALGANMVGGAIAPIVGIAGTLTSGKFGTQAGIQAGEAAAREFLGNFYQPRTQTARDALGAIGNAFNASGIQGVPLPVLNQLAQTMPAATQYARAAVSEAVRPVVGNALNAVRGSDSAKNALVGMGAASTEKAAQRQVTAEGLRVPVKLTKGQITREPGQQAFESDISKTYPRDAGRPLLDAQVRQNDAILRNFDAFTEATGSEMAGPGMLRPIGKIVDSVLVKEAAKKHAQVQAAYNAAREAGEMRAPVPYSAITDFIDSQGPTVRTKIAPVLNAVKEELKKNDPQGTGMVSLNAMEEVRQFINRITEPDTPGGTFGRDIKKLIDVTTENAGGDLYKHARTLRTEYGKQFENVAFVDKLLRMKPGTRDRAVALEDVYEHIINKGSLDETRSVALVLKKAGPEGQQAWRELQGQAIQQMKEAVTRSVSTDLNGNRIPSPAKFDALVREMDNSGKLDYLFGKRGAQEIRDLNETVRNVYSAVPGTVNYSNTASSLIRALDRINSSPLGKTPGLGTVTRFAQEKATQNALARQVDEAVNYNALTRPPSP